MLFICDGIRTPTDVTAWALSEFRLMIWLLSLCGTTARNPRLDAECIDDGSSAVLIEAGEDNRNVPSDGDLLAGLPQRLPGTTINRLCGSDWTHQARRTGD
ncbi:hypothetical protein OIU92_28780 [Escherichia coli]|nr:hypothetical protein [Escherichia coli]